MEDLPKPIPYDYEALVIRPCGAEYQHYETDLVLILKSQRERYTKNRIYGISREAFLPPVIEKSYDNFELAKNLERRYATPLKFGDIVMFNDSDINHHESLILRFKREKPLYEVSSNNFGPLLRIGGVISPMKLNTFWTPLEDLVIPTDIAPLAEPNVWLTAWIRIETNMLHSKDNYHLEYTFDSFAGCDPSDQARVAEAPWHSRSIDSQFSMLPAEPTPCESDDEIDLEPRKDIYVKEDKWAEKINRQLGLFVGGRLLLCKDLPQYDFIIPLLKPVAVAPGEDRTFIYPSIGEYFHFCAVWSIHHKGFLVTEMLPFQILRGYSTSVSGNILVRVNQASLGGLFTDSDSSLGLLDDPYHTLCFSEFHPAAHGGLKALVEVHAVRSSENRSVRWRIVRTIYEDDHVSRFASWLAAATFCVGPIHGMVISKDTVISGDYPSVYFRLPPNSNLSAGCGVRFRGRRAAGVNSEIMIEEIHTNPKFSARKVIGQEENLLFQVPLKVILGHEQLARNEVFGPVDMRQLDPPEDTDDGVFYAWVRESPTIDNCRRACTIMEVFSVALNTPLLPALSGSSRSGSRHSGSSRATLSSSSHGGSTSSRNSTRSINSNRFVGGSARSTPGSISNRGAPNDSDA
ncbi:hypothetical protein L5515_000204 [Caenorhabditis briggsae]|uniref:Uncharacterized protein n=1 Tax=Caenorhabditis briggsae TaxID=6238 RepID=A0AAE9DZ12_CAEBR|nr:hypothetical protein L5515_000204 [Caenorhabditis briggsae]